MAALIHRKSQQSKKPENRKKLAELAQAHRRIAKVRAAPLADDATYQRALPFFKAGAAHFADCADDLKEMVRGLIRYLSKAGMSPEAIREMKPMSSGSCKVYGPARRGSMEFRYQYMVVMQDQNPKMYRRLRDSGS